MKYINNRAHSHSSKPRVGVLISNLGTPNAPTKKALRAYLSQFLSDPRVVELPRLVWTVILHLVILRIRPRRSAKAYAKVWTEEGSPLAVHTQAQCQALTVKLQEKWGDNIVVDWAMRYGQPSIDSTLQSMMDNGVQKLLVLPLYPQYSCSTTASTFDAIAEDFRKRRWLPELRFVTSYHDNPHYIDALAESIRDHWANHGQQQKLLFSFHGVPQRYLTNGDPYHCYCLITARRVAEKLGLADDDYLACFQSRFGREPWLQPYTDHMLKSLAADGVKSVAVICPGFSADCLETIEEVDEENRRYFLESGGETFHYIPCLNSHKTHIHALSEICQQNLLGWDIDQQLCEDPSSEQRYNSCPYNKPSE